MLVEHLSQPHDAASRRFEIIDRQVDWIHTSLLACQPTTILDLGCGPGLYTERLARLGHTCHGIDYSPASIEYAISIAHKEHLDCTYICQDIRQADYPYEAGLVMLLYGEFNVFRPVDANLILGKAWHALKPGGLLLLEPHPFDMVQQLGEKPASWYSSVGGLFSERPHVVLQENFWDGDSNTATTRYYILDANSHAATARYYILDANSHAATARYYILDANSNAATARYYILDANSHAATARYYILDANSHAATARYYILDANSHAATARYYILDAHTGQVCQSAQSLQAYHDDDYRSLLTMHGFEAIQILPGLLGGNSPKDLIAITARKQS